MDNRRNRAAGSVDKMLSSNDTVQQNQNQQPHIMNAFHWVSRTCKVEATSTAIGPNRRAEEAITTRRGVVRPVANHF